MQADADLQVWLETQNHVRPGIVVPYVASNAEQDVHYRIRAVQEGMAGRAVIGQSGNVHIPRDTPAALTRISLGRQPNASCIIEVTLTRRKAEPLHYVFECPA